MTSPGLPMAFIKQALGYRGNSCLIWPYGKVGKGYGSIWLDQKPQLVHRVVCLLTKGPPPTSSHEASHSCGNGHLGCITPGHLNWKTTKENHADKIKHGTAQRGEKGSSTKLSIDEVRTIRSLRGICTKSSLATKFRVSEGTIGDIWHRRTWAWLRSVIKK